MGSLINNGQFKNVLIIGIKPTDSKAISAFGPHIEIIK